MNATTLSHNEVWVDLVYSLKALDVSWFLMCWCLAPLVCMTWWHVRKGAHWAWPKVRTWATEKKTTWRATVHD